MENRRGLNDCAKKTEHDPPEGYEKASFKKIMKIFPGSKLG